MLLALVVLLDNVSVVVVEIALEVGHVRLETVLWQVRHDERLLPKKQTLVLDDPLTAVLQHLDASYEGFGGVHVLTRCETRTTPLIAG